MSDVDLPNILFVDHTVRCGKWDWIEIETGVRSTLTDRPCTCGREQEAARVGAVWAEHFADQLQADKDAYGERVGWLVRPVSGGAVWLRRKAKTLRAGGE